MTVERSHGAPLPDVTRADEERAKARLLEDIKDWIELPSGTIAPLNKWLVARGWRRP